MPNPEDLKSGECIFLSTSPLRFPLSTHPTPDTEQIDSVPPKSSLGVAQDITGSFI